MQQTREMRKAPPRTGCSTCALFCSRADALGGLLITSQAVAAPQGWASHDCACGARLSMPERPARWARRLLGASDGS